MAFPHRRILQGRTQHQCSTWCRIDCEIVVASACIALLTVTQDIVSYGNEHGVSYQYFRVRLWQILNHRPKLTYIMVMIRPRILDTIIQRTITTQHLGISSAPTPPRRMLLYILGMKSTNVLNTELIVLFLNVQSQRCLTECDS